MIWFDFIIHRHLINTVSIVAVPYMFILPINNLYAVRFGFYRIEDDVILLLLSGIICFFIGSVLASFRKRKCLTQDTIENTIDEEVFCYYRMKGMKTFAICAEILCMFRLVSFIRNYGFAALAKDGGENLISGVFGHIYLMIYAILPAIFYYWLKNKKELSYLIIYLFGLAFAFLSFTKYHSIGLVVFTYLLVSFEDYKYIQKGAIVIAGIAVIIFMSNYVIGFFSRGVLNNVNPEFYMLHLWKYIGGSVIHDNTIFTVGQNIDADFVHKLLYCSIALPAMFLSVFGIKIQLPIYIPMQLVGNNSEASNVLDFIGFMYPSKGDWMELFVFILVMVSIGVIFAVFYNCAKYGQKRFALAMCAFMTFFGFLSFFGVFASKSMTWEIVVWGIVIPKLFDKRLTVIWHY